MSDTLQLPAPQSWKQQLDEKNLWYGRFEVYRNLGTDRSLMAAYRLMRKKPIQKGQELQIPSSWSAAYKRHNWKLRAEAYDEFELAQTSDMLEAQRLANKQKRIKLLEKAFEKVNQAIDALTLERMTNLADLTALLRLVVVESRAEYNDQPVTKHKVETSGSPTIQINAIDYRGLIHSLKPTQADYDISEAEDRDIDKPMEITALDLLSLDDGTE